MDLLTYPWSVLKPCDKFATGTCGQATDIDPKLSGHDIQMGKQKRSWKTGIGKFKLIHEGNRLRLLNRTEPFFYRPKTSYSWTKLAY